jgi:TPR repeat protein
MAHDIFVSHSAKDKIAADAVVAHLERSGLRCWCAPRDIVPGASWASSIVNGINNCRAMVIVFSANANGSDHIPREVERAVNRGIPVVPVRIEDVLPHGDLEYFLSSSHWMDAITPPVERHFDRLAEQLRVMLNVSDKSDFTTAKKPLADSPPARSRRGLVWTLGGAAALAMSVVCALLIYNQHKAAGPTAATPANAPPATTAPVTVPAAPAPSAVTLSTPALTVSQSNAPAGSRLFAEYQQWKKLAFITWDNSYLIDHARQRYPEWRRAADQGDPIGQFFVGCAYLHGLTVPEDPAAGFDWLLKSAQAKNSDAMVAVATCCGLGIGTQPNVLQYGRWIKEALDDGNIAAMVTQGVALCAFSSIPTDKEIGKSLFGRAADAGNLDGLYWLGVFCANSPSESEARMEKAAAGGQPDALFVRAEAFKGTGQGRDMVARALKMMGNPLNVARIIDPTMRFGFNHTNLYPDLTWNRLRQMADEGSAEASRLIGELTRKGEAP